MRQTIDIRITIDDSLGRDIVAAEHRETGLKQVGESPTEAAEELFSLLHQTGVVDQ